jgi:FkbM family methyltransferase
MPANRTDHIAYTRNEWENEPYFLKVLEILQSENIISYLDLGANVGEVCNVLFEKIPTLESAYLVEPQLENFEFLKAHVISENRKIEYYPVGIFYGKTTGELFIDPSWQNPGSFALSDDRDNFQPAGETVKLTTLEDLNIPYVDFVKIDVEGSEYNIVENSSYLTGCKYIDIEFHTYTIPSLEFCQKNLPTHSIVLSEGGHLLLKRND